MSPLRWVSPARPLPSGSTVTGSSGTLAFSIVLRRPCVSPRRRIQGWLRGSSGCGGSTSGRQRVSNSSSLYDIRKDLEHEDSEYEAGVEDLVYIFTTCIDAVLSKDPVALIKVTEVKDVVEAPGPAAADAQLIEDFAHAPDTRQLEILKFLLSLSLDESKAELVRANAFQQLRSSASKKAVCRCSRASPTEVDRSRERQGCEDCNGQEQGHRSAI